MSIYSIYFWCLHDNEMKCIRRMEKNVLVVHKINSLNKRNANEYFVQQNEIEDAESKKNEKKKNLLCVNVWPFIQVRSGHSLKDRYPEITLNWHMKTTNNIDAHVPLMLPIK